MFCDNTRRNSLVLVAGDTLNKTFVINGIEANYIDSIYFVCADLGLNEKLTKNQEVENEWVLIVDSEKTKDFQAKVTDYDLKIIFVDGTLYTATYRNSFTIKENKNAIDSGVM